jgi:ribosome biogenesis GTPase
MQIGPTSLNKEDHLLEGIIHKLLGGFYYVMTDSGVICCRARGLFRHEDIKPLVGDRVKIQLDELDDMKGTVVEVLPRSTELVRPSVANVDQAIIVFALTHPKPNLNLLDKLLVLCELSGVEPIIVFNKCDLESDGSHFDDLLLTYALTDYHVLKTSTKENVGIESLKKVLVNRISVFAGPSGVGKSTLLNTLMPGLSLHTGAVSEKIQRGKHTTRHTELIVLPSGGFVLDTPGFTSLDLSSLEGEQLKDYMPDITKLQESCRFDDCVHINEPGCAVIESLNSGVLHFSRYQSYKLMMSQLEKDRRNKSW